MHPFWSFLLSCSLALCISWIANTGATPVWEGLSFWSAEIGSLVPGATSLEAINIQETGGNDQYPIHLTINVPLGEPGNATLRHESSPPVFYLRYGQLWQYNNETNIMPMNVLNVSSSTDAPLQLVVGRQEEGVHGVWTWNGTQLFYEHSSGSNLGLYYSCPTESGHDGVFIFFKASVLPSHCKLFTIHSFQRKQ